MKVTRLYPKRWYDPVLGLFFRFAASGLLPAGWFRKAIPEQSQRTISSDRPTLEIVSHCWRYSNMLAYQLSSLVYYPPTKLKVIVTIFYALEDRDTVDLLNFFELHQPKNVQWNWQPLPKDKLFRRGIGRNMAALSTEADWVWFADCDIIFYRNCLDSLAESLRGRCDILLYPREERTTSMLPSSDPMLQEGLCPQLVNISAERFSLHMLKCATGPFQIVHGDVARTIGYCDGLSIYQTPSRHWCKCYEDRAFRWLVGTQGVPIDVDGIYQIRHIRKGRYKDDSWWSKIRSKIRRMQE